MNIALILKIAEIIGTVLGTLAFALMTYWRAKERIFIKSRGLEDNPLRCDQHETSINNINLAIVGIYKDIQNIKENITEIKGKLK